jgi:hypothetical protein
MESYFHSIIPFLPLFISFQFRRLDSIQFLCSQAHIPAGWRPETRLFTSPYAAEHFFITTLHGPRRKRNLYFQGGLFTDPLPSNGCLIVARDCFRGNVFIESLPSNGCTRHNMVQLALQSQHLLRINYHHSWIFSKSRFKCRSVEGFHVEIVARTVIAYFKTFSQL